jgi:hypothetical protein
VIAFPQGDLGTLVAILLTAFVHTTIAKQHKRLFTLQQSAEFGKFGEGIFRFAGGLLTHPDQWEGCRI